ncbi:MAG: response regulator [Spartobacteria bacterium]|nr:response regulator [Spartobacteria bacterium]
MKIMVVEDEKQIRDNLKILLESIGHEVVVASNGLEAFETYDVKPVQVIVSDWMMPGINGLELCKKIRAREEDAYCYFILLTARANRDDYIEAMACGVDDFMVKPLNIEDLTIRLHVAARILGYARHINHLESMLPICNHCKKIRQEDGRWVDFKSYISDYVSKQFSKSICPSCAKIHIIHNQSPSVPY